MQTHNITRALDSCTNIHAIEAWPSQKFLFLVAAMLLFYIVQRITKTKLIYF
jgi:hypothetical protein